MIKVGQIVKLSSATKKFCNDMEISLFKDSISNIDSTTFLVIEVYEDSLEADAISSEGIVLRFGVHDIEPV